MTTEANPHGYPQPIGPWERKLRQGTIRMIEPQELKAWITYEDDRLLVINKPGDVVCHPSKDGPWSSLVGAVREHLGGGETSAHLIFRLDRETSGLVLFAKDAAMARRLQMAAQERRYAKAYYVVLVGELPGPVSVDQPLGPDRDSPVLVKSKVTEAAGSQRAVTRYEVVARAGGVTLARVVTETGRKHQIRAHAQWLGYPVVGDKIYGPDPRLFLEFIEQGWTPALADKLWLPRQALHCAEIDLTMAGLEHLFRVGIPKDMVDFCHGRGMSGVPE